MFTLSQRLQQKAAKHKLFVKSNDMLQLIDQGADINYISSSDNEGVSKKSTLCLLVANRHITTLGKLAVAGKLQVPAQHLSRVIQSFVTALKQTYDKTLLTAFLAVTIKDASNAQQQQLQLIQLFYCEQYQVKKPVSLQQTSFSLLAIILTYPNIPESLNMTEISVKDFPSIYDALVKRDYDKELRKFLQRVITPKLISEDSYKTENERKNYHQLLLHLLSSKDVGEYISSESKNRWKSSGLLAREINGFYEIFKKEGFDNITLPSEFDHQQAKNTYFLVRKESKLILKMKQAIVQERELVNYALEYKYGSDDTIKRIDLIAEQSNQNPLRQNTLDIQRKLPKASNKMEQVTTANSNTTQELGYMQKAAAYIDQRQKGKKIDEYNVYHDTNMFPL